jgi:NADPH:quinone reductase-like Zn-dependent oxidoreductase
MRAIIHAAPGDPGVLQLRDVPTPEPGPNQVRVRVRAAGLNRADILQRKGRYAAPPGWPADIPGLEYAGEVELLGPGVTRWRPGDRVMGLVGGGAHAEYVVVHEDEAMAIPAGIGFPEAAAIPEAFLTAWDALVTRGRMAAGERVLIHAVGSGVGTAAVQLVRFLGGASIGTSRRADKLERARELGLDEAIDTSGGGFAQKLSAPVNVILDVLGGPAFAENLEALALRGRLVMLGFLQGARTEASLDPILRKRLEVIGSVMRTRQLAERIELVREFSERALGGFAAEQGSRRAAEQETSGAGEQRSVSLPSTSAPPLRRSAAPLSPVIAATFPFAEIAAAHQAMERDENFGKIVLIW